MSADRLRAPTADERAAWIAELGDPVAHQRIVAGLDCLDRVETSGDIDLPPLSGWVRVAAWNVERGRHPAAVAAALNGCGAGVALLTEVDSGMARSGNRDNPAELAAMLEAAYAYGVEFIELGPGDAGEAREVSGPNERGLHGNLILARTPLLQPAIVRLDQGGEWFCAERGQPRVGGRVAIMATVMLDAVEVAVASVHLESASDPHQRATQLAAALEAIERRVSNGPAVIGGDLNTFGAPLNELADRHQVRRLRRTSPARFSWPVDEEPLFSMAEEKGYDWIDANVAAPTTRHDARGLPDHVPLKLDWILVRGLDARRPATVPAVAADGTPLSDHDMVAVSVRLTASGRRR